ncbi:hypothetical protein NC653_005349 [Populus alba x Populus x berolinensis]|uniref:Uncharacterized protein n=1 Tax=Populus alba x Populus x berolinensis TaxID=444605 RepID=A0AAD6WAX2_9ROSI|nr:hypothetical protein NC653_005349 [Populus alba x Populus x berolinensis]
MEGRGLWMNTYRRMRSNKLSAEEKRRLREPWKQTLFIKIMGRTIHDYIKKTLEVGHTTSFSTRSNYARICDEVNIVIK